LSATFVQDFKGKNMTTALTSKFLVVSSHLRPFGTGGSGMFLGTGGSGMNLGTGGSGMPLGTGGSGMHRGSGGSGSRI